MNLTLSIITIVYNGMPYLKECIESVLNQEVSSWELLISDDGSSDGSREYLRTLNDPRIKVFEQEINLGIFNNLNFLFAKAKAPVCQILCQDDHFTTSRSLTTLMAYWDNAPATLGFVRFNHQNVAHASPLVKFEKNVLPNVIKAGQADFWFYTFGNISGNLSNISLRTHVVQSVGMFDQSLPYAGDFEFWNRAAKKYDMGIQGELIVYVRTHKKQASSYLNYKGELVHQKILIVNKLFRSLVELYPEHRGKLKFHGTLQYDTLDRYLAVKFLFKGSKAYLAEINKQSAYNDCISKNIKWTIFFLSLGGRIGRAYSAKRLLKAFSNSVKLSE